jgi:hypothetical protein
LRHGLSVSLRFSRAERALLARFVAVSLGGAATRDGVTLLRDGDRKRMGSQRPDRSAIADS